MAKLYFRYGAMGSSKTANALMVEYNYRERGKRALLTKPMTDTRDGERIVSSRMGLKAPCIWFEEMMELDEDEIRNYNCIIVDEAQFCSKEQVEFLVHLVDDLNIPVVCYGLRADFQNNLFPGSMWLLAWADTIEEIKTVCWCGRAAKCNARINENGIVREGSQVYLGGNDSYIALCRRHFREGNIGKF
jgi:thymidine kinase